VRGRFAIELITNPCSAFQFQKRSQLFICAHNETLSVVALRVSNKRLYIVDALRVKGFITPTRCTRNEVLNPLSSMYALYLLSFFAPLPVV